MNAATAQAVRPEPGPDTLIFGIGNCGRSDDGLGWAFLDRISADDDFDFPVEYRYQLQVEDAAQVACVKHVIFVDSYAGDLPGGFRWQRCETSEDFQFTTHVLPPRGVMFYCKDIFGKSPRADILTISGREWGLRNSMSEAARNNLENALVFFKRKMGPGAGSP